MAISEIIFYIFLSIGLINVLHFCLYLAGADIYDIWQMRRIARLPKRRHDIPRPLVSVVIAAFNEELSIVRCLESIRTNSYRKWEVIVVDDGSKDKTHQLVMDYICRHPNRSISLLKMPKNSGKAAALNYGLRRHAKGDLIMTLDADSILHKDAIKNAVTYFENKKVAGVAANVRIMDSPSILGILQRFEHMIGYRSKKFYSLTNSEFIVGGVASTYRREVMKMVKYYDRDTTTEDIGLSLKITALGNKNYRLIYGSNVLAMTEGVQTFKALLRQRYRWKLGMLQNLIKNIHLVANNDPKYGRMLTMYRLPMAFFSEFVIAMEPFIWAYVIYLSIAFQTPALITGAYMTISLYVLWTIWPDEHSSFTRKLTQSAYAPVLYFIFYIMSFVQVVSIVRCVINYKKVFRRNKNEGAWISPERSGKAVQFS